MNTTPKGYQPLSSMLEKRVLSLRRSVEAGKSLLKLLIHLHDREIAQENLTINDVYIKLSLLVSIDPIL